MASKDDFAPPIAERGIAAAAPGPSLTRRSSRPNLAADWTALRPRPNDAPGKAAQQAVALERAVQSLPTSARTAYLLDLAVYALKHDSDGDATLFLQATLLEALERHTSPSTSEHSAMNTFARYFDDAHPFTAARRDGTSDQDVYELQLTELARSPAAALLGYLYLRDLRAAALDGAEAMDHDQLRASVLRYTFLQRTEAFGGRAA